MAQPFQDVTGDLDDRVSLELNGKDAPILESYEVEKSILTQPARLRARIGWGGVTRDLLDVLPPNLPIRVFIGDVPCFIGALDGWEATDDAGATQIDLRARDNLAPLHDAFIEAELAVKNLTYAQLVEKALGETVGDFTLFFTNESNRTLTAGTTIRQTTAPTVDPQQAVTGPVQRVLQAHIGERWYEYVKRQLDHAGLFLWSAGDGSFILSTPNSSQAPTYRILRRRGQTRNEVNVLRAALRNDTSGRYTEAVIHGRGGGRKFGRSHTQGTFTDDEMLRFGFKRPLVLRDINVTNNEQAAFYARRKLAETRRAGFSLMYTVAGHTIPSAIRTSERAVWIPDTIVNVTDEEYGIEEDFWIERCVYRRSSAGTTTELTLMRPADLVFANPEGIT